MPRVSTSRRVSEILELINKEHEYTTYKDLAKQYGIGYSNFSLKLSGKRAWTLKNELTILGSK